MEKTGQEWVSAAVDGQIDKESLAQLAADTDSQQQWARYHLIGDAMRGELPETIHLDLSAGIAAAIEQEPTVLAPRRSSAQDKLGGMLRHFGQYGIAAAVALVAVVGVQNYQAVDTENAPLPVLNTRPLVGSASPVSLQTGAAQQNQGMINEQLLEQRRRINAYLQDHMLQQRLNTGVVVDENSEETPVNR
ncbi:sigma-E factor negative regulatory protein [Shewanella sedimentimangrovi]|uniref:Anti-sigma-E factor RseA n=1 Tax=Shewanella sedimentimangrovi TaxID=2814293 RepID=A0ABX7R4E6_9GAMM|nr:RseA family anti-sigma factor [Shewanella sedimentimangrovi]QSX38036.1 anti-sigma factor [Shewanella sedimentimangrovi]